MKIFSIIRSSIFQIISFIFVLGYFLGILNIHFSDKNDYCVMTYMFEYPQFVRISVPENKIYPQYGLYAYSEGRFTERARKMWFDGVPVLFLPGNSGSHMQSRSLASVALRKALAKGYEYHFDFFTISYNEELSALYGGVLQSQTKFAAACVSRILNLYKSNKYTKSVPTSVILIGHSMGGVVARRLLAYPSTLNTTNIAITLAAPLEAPVINFDATMNDYYMLMDLEWEVYVKRHKEIKDKKVILSFGSGPRDILVPSGLTSSNESDVSALMTAIPGVWVSSDHVSIVWCKQLVLAINRYLFDIIDPLTEQIVENKEVLTSKARYYFEANRSMTLSPDISRQIVPMQADAFWYEDNRRIYQISRQTVDMTTYLMIRLVSFHQNRFVAIEAINLDDNDWVFGCNAQYSSSSHRYCKEGTSLSELSRWTGAALDFGKRKIATIHLHRLKDMHPDWTHVLVKVSPTRKPVILNVDINDHASRQITVDLPSDFWFGKSIIIEETQAESLYYELILPNFSTVHQAYLLYIEPTAKCKATQYHVSAEVHVPWAKNHEYYHYFTPVKRSPMKLRIFKSNPNITIGLEPTDHVKVTVLLDPQCTFTISISSSWYHRLAQLVRNYSPILVPYIAAIVLLTARSVLMNLNEHGRCISIHSALMSEGVKPYYALVSGRLGATLLMAIPFITIIFENASWKNLELRYFTRSLLVLPAYMTALGLLNIGAAAILAVMVFSSQLAHRLLFRIMWRGGRGLAERVAAGLQRVPMIVSAGLVCAAPLSCGAASLAVGAAFYAFMLSKMYEEYLEDYVYKLMAKVASRICRVFKSKDKASRNESKSLISKENVVSNNDKSENLNENPSHGNEIIANTKLNENKTDSDNVSGSEESCDQNERNVRKTDEDIDEELNNLHFHMMLFLMWLCVTLVNMPALLTWAKNFKYSMVLKPDTSYHTGLIMSACSACLWQMDGPRKNLKYYEAVSALLFTMSVFILALGPLSLSIVNYGMTFMYAVITMQQICDKEEYGAEVINSQDEDSQDDGDNENECEDKSANESDNDGCKVDENQTEPSDNGANADKPSDECDVCNESRIYNIFKNLREKFSFNDNL